MSEFRRIVVKVGTKVLTDEKGVLDDKSLIRIASQIAKLKQEGYEVTLVSSGAMSSYPFCEQVVWTFV